MSFGAWNMIDLSTLSVLVFKSLTIFQIFGSIFQVNKNHMASIQTCSVEFTKGERRSLFLVFSKKGTIDSSLCKYISMGPKD